MDVHSPVSFYSVTRVDFGHIVRSSKDHDMSTTLLISSTCTLVVISCHSYSSGWYQKTTQRSSKKYTRAFNPFRCSLNWSLIRIAALKQEADISFILRLLHCHLFENDPQSIYPRGVSVLFCFPERTLRVYSVIPSTVQMDRQHTVQNIVHGVT